MKSQSGNCLKKANMNIVLMAILLGPILAMGKVAEALCPAPFVALQTGCYHFSNLEEVTWDQAYFTCQLLFDSYLVEIESDEEQRNITNHITSNLGANKAWWVGATDILSEGTFRWMTSGNLMTYTAWRSGEPNDNDNEDCVHLVDGTLAWNDKNCSSTSDFSGYMFSFICETDY